MKCFVMMPFAGMDDVFEFYYDLCKSLGVKCYRIDGKKYRKPGIISNDILNEIKKADMIIADTTGDNPNVFYELGFAHFISLENVIITRQSSSGKLPFDIQGIRAIFYDMGNLNGMNTARHNISAFINNVIGMKYSPSASICAFYKFISSKKYKQAWEHISSDFKIRRWNDKFDEFVDGYRHTMSITHVNTEEITSNDNQAKFHVSYIEEVDAPIIHELEGIGGRKLSDLSSIYKELEALYNRLHEHGFSKEEAQALTINQAVSQNKGQILSWRLKHKSDGRNPDEILGPLKLSKAHYWYEVSMQRIKGQWLINSIRPIR